MDGTQSPTQINMTFARFKQIWDTLVTNRPKAKVVDGRPPIVQEGSSHHTLDALCRASDDDFSDFDEIEEQLALHDSHDRS